MARTNKVHEYFLKNGFKLIVKEDHRSPAAIFQIFYKVGSGYEYNGITGISHVLEHMMFEGTRKHNAAKFQQKISEFAVQNAHTGHDYTTYYEITQAAKLEDCIYLEADRMQNLLLQKKDFMREMQIVMEERRLLIGDPQQYTYERFAAAAYLSSPYHHPIIGWMDDLKNMSVQDLIHWYKRWYVPNNAIGVVVGDVVPQKMHQLVKKHFGPITSSVLPELKPQNEVSAKGMRIVIIKAPAELSFFVLGYNTPVLNTAEKKWESYALLILCELLVGSESARLQKNLIKEKQMAVDVSYRYSPFNRINNVLALLITLAPEQKIEEVKNSVLDEIYQLHSQLSHSKELERVKINIIANRIYEEDSIANQAAEIGSFEAVGLSWKEIDRAYKIIETITPEQIQQVAQKYLTEDRLIIANLVPLPLSEKMPIKQKYAIKHQRL